MIKCNDCGHLVAVYKYDACVVCENKIITVYYDYKGICPYCGKEIKDYNSKDITEQEFIKMIDTISDMKETKKLNDNPFITKKALD